MHRRRQKRGIQDSRINIFGRVLRGQRSILGDSSSNSNVLIYRYIANERSYCIQLKAPKPLTTIPQSHLPLIIQKNIKNLRVDTRYRQSQSTSSINKNGFCGHESLKQCILNKKIKKDQVYYLIKWRNFGKKDATWEPVSRLTSIQILIDAYEEEERRKQLTKSLGKKFKITKNVKKKSKSEKDFDDTKSVYSQVSKVSKADCSKSEIFEEKPKNQVQKNEVRVSLYQVKLNEKLKEQERSGKIQPQGEKVSKERTSRESKDSKQASKEKLKKESIIESSKNWEIVKIVYIAAMNKRLLEVKVGNFLVLKQLDEVKKICPQALCNFYEKIFKIIL